MWHLLSFSVQFAFARRIVERESIGNKSFDNFENYIDILPIK